MRLRRSNEDFIKAHWDKLAALGGFVVLAIVVLFTYVLPSGDTVAQPGAGRVASKKKFESDTASLEAVFARVGNPQKLAEVPVGEKCFLASEVRVSCSSPEGKGCGRPIPLNCKECPSCGAKQTKEVKVIVDTDGDGLLDEYEKAHGLDPNVADADADKDGDGFSNKEEFAAKTNPADASSHPDYIDYAQLSAPLKQEFSLLQFDRVTELPGKKYRYYFKMPGRQNEVDRGNFSALKDEEIGKTGFKVVAYEPKSYTKPVKGGMPLKIDVSEVSLKRISDGKVIKFVIHATKTDTDVQATLSFSRGGVENLQVVEGQKFNVKDTEFLVVKILGKGEGRERESVMLKNLKTNKVRVIESP